MSDVSDTSRSPRSQSPDAPAGSEAAWRPPDVQVDRPSAARMYDYLLGGHHNFAIDRTVAEAAIAIYPDFGLMMQANRMFLRRAVHFLIEQGIDQFLDIGSGIPTAGNVHQVAQQANPAARVVYVDNDPIAVAHSTAMLADVPGATIVEADIRDTRSVLDHPSARALLDSGRPTGLLLVALLHFVVDDDQARQIVRELTAALPHGSYLVISHGTGDVMTPGTMEQLEQLYRRSANPVRTRPRAEIARYFEGLELVPPGLVLGPCWRPEDPEDLLVSEPERSGTLVGVARKP
jgi:S-adenosyl methyltransferase